MPHLQSTRASHRFRPPTLATMNGSAGSATAVVVGGGVIGLCTARALRHAGFAVRILERGGIGRQASWAGGGILSPLYPWRAPEPVWDLAARSIDAYPALCAELAERSGVDPEWTPSGMLVLDADECGTARFWASRTGRRVEETLHDGRPALWLPWVAQVRNPRLCRALRLALEREGVRCEEGQGALRLAVEAGRAVVVDPAGGRHHADVVVVAAGAWSAALLAETGWSLPVVPVKGQMILLQGAPGALDRILLQGGRYLIPRRDGRILVGSTVEPEAGFTTATDPAVADALQAFAASLLPAAAGFVREAHWSGLRPGSPDERPLIERHPRLPNLFVNAGHYRNGLTLAPASAERLLGAVASG